MSEDVLDRPRKSSTILGSKIDKDCNSRCRLNRMASHFASLSETEKDVFLFALYHAAQLAYAYQRENSDKMQNLGDAIWDAKEVIV